MTQEPKLTRQALTAAEDADNMDREAMIAGIEQDCRLILTYTFPTEVFDAISKSIGDAVPAGGMDCLRFETMPEDGSGVCRITLPTPDKETADPPVNVNLRNVSIGRVLTLPVTLWGDGTEFVFRLHQEIIRLAPYTRQGEELVSISEEEAAWRRRLGDALNARNRRLGLPVPWDPLAPTEPPVPAKLPARPRPLRTAIRFKSDNVHAATVRAFSTVQNWQKGVIEGFAYGVTHGYENLEVTVGLPESSQAEDLWAYLMKGGARMVKAHYALWGRWYEGGGKPGEFVTVNISQFCADLGYTRHHKGGFRRERKQEAVKILEALTAVEMRATFTPPGKKATQRLRGPLWSRGLLAEENDQYEDLFGQARAGDPNLWEPLAFSYAPGPWFSHPDWTRYNRAIGKIGAGLMRLENDKDQWAILIGGYLGTLMRVNHYAPRRLRVDTILTATGLAQGTDAKRRVNETEEKFTRALDRLVEIGVIASWTWPEVDATELSDPDDPDTVAAYYAAEPLPKGNWRARLVEFTLPAEIGKERARLGAAQAKAVAQTRTRRRRTAKKDADTTPKGK